MQVKHMPSNTAKQILHSRNLTVMIVMQSLRENSTSWSMRESQTSRKNCALIIMELDGDVNSQQVVWIFTTKILHLYYIMTKEAKFHAAMVTCVVFIKKTNATTNTQSGLSHLVLLHLNQKKFNFLKERNVDSVIMKQTLTLRVQC